MKIGIVYFSKTGNTKKLANIAKDEFLKKGDNVDLIPLDKFKNDVRYDLLILGSFCASNAFPKPFIKLLETIKNETNVVCFATHATEVRGKYYDTWAKGCEDYYKSFCEKNNITYNYFHTQAKPSIAISFFIKLAVFKNARKDWDDYRKTMNSYPREEDINEFRNWINSLL